MSADTLYLATVFVFAALIGCAVGSFLNVVIARTPRLIDAPSSSFLSVLRGLSWPPSHCGACKTDLTWRDNIPVIAWLALRGRCRYCREPYGARYLLVELLGAAIAVGAVALAGPGWQAALLAAFAFGVVALVVIDLEAQLLPDVILAPLFLLGLAYQTAFGAGLVGALGAAALGLGALWAIRAAWRLATGVDGMGLGDLKLAAVLGAWVGLTALPAALFLAFAAGTAVMGAMVLTGRMKPDAPVPFGPFLAAGALAVMAVPALPAAMARLAGY